MARLRDRQSELATLDARIVTVSFRSAEEAPAWLEETGSPFPLLVDARRETYAAIGMRRSLGRS